MLGRDHAVPGGEGVEQRVPEQPAGAVQEQDRVALTGAEHADLEQPVAQLDDGLFGSSSHSPATGSAATS